MSNNVEHPSHYNQSSIECIEAIKAATVGKTGIEAFCVGNAIKYLWRFEEKNGVEDAKKAAWYINRLIGELEDVNNEDPYDDYYFCCEYCKYFELPGSKEPCNSCKYSVVTENDLESHFEPA